VSVAEANANRPSGMPMTFPLYLRMAALTVARMTAFKPGASPPPVQIPMHFMSSIATHDASAGARKRDVTAVTRRRSFRSGRSRGYCGFTVSIATAGWAELPL